MKYHKYDWSMSLVACALLLFGFAQKSVALDEPEPQTSYDESNFYYVIATSLNLRSEPQADAAIVTKLKISEPVEIMTTEGKWVRLRVVRSRDFGWTLKEFISDVKPTTQGMWDSYLKANPAGLSEQRKHLERALAIDPDDLSALAALASNYEISGNAVAARQVRRNIEFIRNPDVSIDSSERQVLFVLSGNQLEPLAFLDDGKLSSAFRNSAELDQLLARYARAGRRYNVFSQEGPAGTAEITKSVTPGSIDLDVCRDAVKFDADIRLKITPKKSTLLLATNRPVNPARNTPRRSLTAQERKELSKLAGAMLQRKLLYQPPNLQPLRWQEVEFYKKVSQMTPKLSGAAMDMEGNGIETIVASMYYEHPPIQLLLDTGPHSEFGAYVLIIARKSTSKSQWKILFQEVFGDHGDAIIRDFNLLGFVDINGDGALDIVTQDERYESSSIGVIESSIINGNLGYQRSSAFSSGGC